MKEYFKAAAGGGGTVGIDEVTDLDYVEDSYEASGVARGRTRLGGGGGRRRGGGSVASSRYLPPSNTNQNTHNILSSFGTIDQDLGSYTG